MVNQKVLQGNWKDIKGKLREKWGMLTNDDVQRFDGNVDRLVGLIQRKTGEGRESIETFLSDATANGASAVGNATETVRDYAQRAAAQVQDGVSQVGESVREGYESLQGGYEDAEEIVRRHPGEASAICFGAGLLTGLVVALLIQRK